MKKVTDIVIILATAQFVLWPRSTNLMWYHLLIVFEHGIDVWFIVKLRYS